MGLHHNPGFEDDLGLKVENDCIPHLVIIIQIGSGTPKSSKSFPYHFCVETHGDLI